MLDLYEGLRTLVTRLSQSQIHRLTKPDPGSEDFLSLDLLLVTPDLEEVWQSRQVLDWEGGRLQVVSREGLIALKALRNSGQDQDDIARLRKGSAE